MGSSNEKPALKSRKFLAWVLSSFAWKILAALVLFWGKDSMPGMVFGILLAIVLVSGFLDAGFLLGQASLDKYVRVAEIAVGAGHEMSMGTMTIGKPKPVVDPVPVINPVEIPPSLGAGENPVPLTQKTVPTEPVSSPRDLMSQMSTPIPARPSSAPPPRASMSPPPLHEEKSRLDDLQASLEVQAKKLSQG